MLLLERYNKIRQHSDFILTRSSNSINAYLCNNVCQFPSILGSTLKFSIFSIIWPRNSWIIKKNNILFYQTTISTRRTVKSSTNNQKLHMNTNTDSSITACAFTIIPNFWTIRSHFPPKLRKMTCVIVHGWASVKGWGRECGVSVNLLIFTFSVYLAKYGIICRLMIESRYDSCRQLINSN